MMIIMGENFSLCLRARFFPLSEKVRREKWEEVEEKRMKTVTMMNGHYMLQENKEKMKRGREEVEEVISLGDSLSCP